MKPIKRILLIRADRMGDVVLTTPVFRAIKEQLPDSHLALLVAKENFELVSDHPFLDEVIVYDKNGTEGKNPLGFLAFIGKLRKKKFDIAIHFHPRARFYWLTFLAGIPQRIGYRYKNYQLLTRAEIYDKPEGSRHEAEYNFDLLDVLRVSKPKLIRPCIVCNEKFETQLRPFLDLETKFAVFNPSASSTSKMWPIEFFAEVADALQLQHGFTCVMVGGVSDLAVSNRMGKMMKSKSVNLTGKISPGALPCLFKKSQIVISNDTGPAHVAAATGARIISIFTRNLSGLGPERWRPLGQNVRFLVEPVVRTVKEANESTLKVSDFRELLPTVVIKEAEMLLCTPVSK